MPRPSRPDFVVPGALDEALRHYFGPAGGEFASGLPALIADLAHRWSLSVGEALPGARTAWAAPCLRDDGSEAVLRIGFPERPPGSEAEALRAWAGRGAVRLLEADASCNAQLLERCVPGTPLSSAAGADEVLAIGARLLDRLWRDSPAEPLGPSLAELARLRSAEGARRAAALADAPRPQCLDEPLVADGLALWSELAAGGGTVLLHADLAPRNVLSASREPWLVIDPKPLVGDPCYELAPLVLEAGPTDGEEIGRRVRLLSDRLGLDAGRVAAWGVARGVDWALFCCERDDALGAARAAEQAAAFAAIV